MWVWYHFIPNLRLPTGIPILCKIKWSIWNNFKYCIIKTIVVNIINIILKYLLWRIRTSNCCFVPDASIIIPLNKTTAFDDRELYGGFITLDGKSNVQVNFSNVDKSLEFIVFQVHTHIYNVSLIMTDNVGLSVANGTNIGFVSFLENKGTFKISNYNMNVTVRAYISVHGYKGKGMKYYIYNFKFTILSAISQFHLVPFIITNSHNYWTIIS